MREDAPLLVSDKHRSPPSRVLYITALDPSLKFGSMEEQILILARAFKEHGSIFLPLFQAPLGPQVAAEFRASMVEAEWADLSQFNLATIRRLIGLIRLHNIEVIHWNFYHPLNPYVWVLSLLRPGLRFFLTDHSSRGLDACGNPVTASRDRLRKLIRRVLLKRYVKVLCISDFVLSCLRSEGTWSNTLPCTHLINCNRFQPDLDCRGSLREMLDIHQSYVVLVVAHLIRAKGVEVVLKSLTRLPDKTILWVVGDGEETYTLKEMSRHLSVESRVRFFGWRSDVHKYMQAADCLVVPSLWQEAAGLVVLEGLASGLPVVGSDVGAIPEFIEDGKTGFLFPAGNDKRLAEILRDLECNPDLCQEIGRRAREAAVERFSPQVRLPEYLDLYRPLAG